MRVRACILAFSLAAGCADRALPPEHPLAAPPVPPPSPSPAAPAASPAVADGKASASPCEGDELDLLAVLANAACRIGEDEGSALRNVLEDPSQAPLEVAATALPDGRVRVRIRNTGKTALSVPLLIHSALDNFSVRAGQRQLAPPQPDWPPGFAFEHSRMLSKLVLAPGGSAEATLRIDPEIVTHEIRNCPPNAKCAPTTVSRGRLPPGETSLTIRTPLYSIRADLAATLAWQAP